MAACYAAGVAVTTNYDGAFLPAECTAATFCAVLMIRRLHIGGVVAVGLGVATFMPAAHRHQFGEDCSGFAAIAASLGILLIVVGRVTAGLAALP